MYVCPLNRDIYIYITLHLWFCRIGTAFKTVNVCDNKGNVLNAVESTRPIRWDINLVSVVWSFLELGRYIPGYNCWNTHRLLHPLPFKFDFEDVYTQANAWNQPKKKRQQESETIGLLVERLSLSCVFRSVSANYDRDCSQGLPVQCITGSYINTWMKREKAKQHFQGIKATARHSNPQKGVFAPPSLFRVPLARDLSRDPLRPLEESWGRSDTASNTIYW